VAARQHVWASWALIRKQFKCAIENHPEAEQLVNSKNRIKTNLIKKTEKHSVRCLFRMFMKRTTWKRVYKTEEGEKIVNKCEHHTSTAITNVSAIIEQANEDGKWLAKSCGCKTAGYSEVIDEIRSFF